MCLGGRISGKFVRGARRYETLMLSAGPEQGLNETPLQQNVITPRTHRVPFVTAWGIPRRWMRHSTHHIYSCITHNSCMHAHYICDLK